MKDFFNKVWLWLDGNKMLIGALGLLILEQDFAADLNPGIVNILTWLFVTIGGTGAIHKAEKFRKKITK